MATPVPIYRGRGVQPCLHSLLHQLQQRLVVCHPQPWELQWLPSSVTAFHLAVAHLTLLTTLTTRPTVPASSIWAPLSYPSSRESPFLL